MSEKREILIKNYRLSGGKVHDFKLTYQVFGKSLFSAPVVLVNHALTGNSEVAGKNGWWKSLIGEQNTIDLRYFTVLAFNIPGNAYDENPEFVWENYAELTTQIIADLFWKGLRQIGIHQLFAVIGGSLGGAIAWEMAFLQPHSILHLIPIAATWKSSDWLIGNVLVQERILNHSTHPVEDARIHAMLTYRTPISLAHRFDGKWNEKEVQFEVESWLKYHGNRLKNRMSLPTYKLMNHLLKTIGVGMNQSQILRLVKNWRGTIHLIAINTDVLFPNQEQKTIYHLLQYKGVKVEYNEIISIHGHDAFLIEYKQLGALLSPLFNNKNHENFKVWREIIGRRAIV